MEHDLYTTGICFIALDTLIPFASMAIAHGWLTAFFCLSLHKHPPERDASAGGSVISEGDDANIHYAIRFVWELAIWQRLDYVQPWLGVERCLRYDIWLCYT